MVLYGFAGAKVARFMYPRNKLRMFFENYFSKRGAVMDYIGEDGTETCHKTFHRYHHKYQPHETHHDIVACLPKKLIEARGCAENKIGDDIYHKYGGYEGCLKRKGVGLLHEHDTVGNGTGTAKERDGKRSDGDIVGIGAYLLIRQFNIGKSRLEHIVPDLENDDAGSNAETVCRNAEEGEEELPCDGERYQHKKRDDSGAHHYMRSLLLVHAGGHGEEHGHSAKRIGKRKE